jgi:hypothetical protein
MYNDIYPLLAVQSTYEAIPHMYTNTHATASDLSEKMQQGYPVAEENQSGVVAYVEGGLSCRQRACLDHLTSAY